MVFVSARSVTPPRSYHPCSPLLAHPPRRRQRQRRGSVVKNCQYPSTWPLLRASGRGNRAAARCRLFPVERRRRQAGLQRRGSGLGAESGRGRHLGNQWVRAAGGGEHGGSARQDEVGPRFSVLGGPTTASPIIPGARSGTQGWPPPCSFRRGGPLQLPDPLSSRPRPPERRCPLSPTPWNAQAIPQVVTTSCAPDGPRAILILVPAHHAMRSPMTQAAVPRAVRG